MVYIPLYERHRGLVVRVLACGAEGPQIEITFDGVIGKPSLLTQRLWDLLYLFTCRWNMPHSKDSNFVLTVTLYKLILILALNARTPLTLCMHMLQPIWTDIKKCKKVVLLLTFGLNMDSPSNMTLLKTAVSNQTISLILEKQVEAGQKSCIS